MCLCHPPPSQVTSREIHQNARPGGDGAAAPEAAAGRDRLRPGFIRKDQVFTRNKTRGLNLGFIPQVPNQEYNPALFAPPGTPASGGHLPLLNLPPPVVSQSSARRTAPSPLASLLLRAGVEGAPKSAGRRRPREPRRATFVQSHRPPRACCAHAQPQNRRRTSFPSLSALQCSIKE